MVYSITAERDRVRYVTNCPILPSNDNIFSFKTRKVPVKPGPVGHPKRREEEEMQYSKLSVEYLHKNQPFYTKKINLLLAYFLWP